ncbi:two-component regulator propeller domain-containing protein [Algibacter lectus]|uniref:two-component regulator propeller domain-containing protein n=1 Tax=Algibacter lectus TaxID=221126 RepID=UPI0034E4F37F
MGTHKGGLNFFNPNIWPYNFIRYQKNPINDSSLSDNRVISLCEDSQNNIWIGTEGGGLNFLILKQIHYQE